MLLIEIHNELFTACCTNFALPKQELLLVAVAAGPGADRWGGGALRFGSGALATRAGRERALKDIGRLQLVFGGQCPLGLHALLPVDKTYVAVVLRVALWQIGPAADASRNNLLVDASARENVSASSEGAQALAAWRQKQRHSLWGVLCRSPPAPGPMAGPRLRAS